MSQQQVSEETSTKHGIPIDYGFARAADEKAIERAAESLVKRGFAVDVVSSPEEARSLVRTMLPHDKTIFTATSETVRLSGLDEDINGSKSPFRSLRREINNLGPQTSYRDRVKMQAVPDVVIGSVHAITEEGQVLVASASGSQLGAYAAGAEKVIWIVGSQKIVPDLKTALRRIRMYSYPLEDMRAREAYNMASMIAKTLIIDAERPGRINIILVRSPIGY
ncbi:LUD domain-containing protein [Candidatus Bathyarchaeota archaeon]|nr:LUD domain-containing protein [Candidatus Bathyarchaeota archaeon]